MPLQHEPRKPPLAFALARRFWAPFLAVFLGLVVLWLFTGWFWIGIVGVIGLIWLMGAKLSDAGHEF